MVRRIQLEERSALDLRFSDRLGGRRTSARGDPSARPRPARARDTAHSRAPWLAAAGRTEHQRQAPRQEDRHLQELHFPTPCLGIQKVVLRVTAARNHLERMRRLVQGSPSGASALPQQARMTSAVSGALLNARSRWNSGKSSSDRSSSGTVSACSALPAYSIASGYLRR